MAFKYDPIQGLHTKTGFHKSILKGEDAWLQKPGVTLSSSPSGSATAEVYGVFDGHGGKQAAVFSSKQLVNHLQQAIAKQGHQENANNQPEVPKELQTCAEVKPEVWEAWDAQERLVACLPEAFVTCFKTLQDGFFEQSKESGTTATVACLVGWELVVANVGDSCAFLDTGTEVLQVSGNHRLDDNKKEKERIKKQGFEVSSSKVEGRPTGPLRVWPGGLAMGRSLGDYEAGDIVLSKPEVRQVTIPEVGGRIVVASDGLWDAVTPKTALHHIRGMPASKAARELVQMAVKGRDLKDDVTVLVIDATPDEEHRLPPLLSKDGAGRLQADYMDVGPVNVYHPLEDGDVGSQAWRRLLWQRRLAAVKLKYPHVFNSNDPAEDLLSGSLSETHLDSGDDTLTAPAREESSFDDGGYEQHYSFNDQIEDDDHASAHAWTTVPEKSRAVPVKSRKHPLQRDDSSPSNAVPAPKAQKENPLSPQPGSMQTSEMGSNQGSFPGRFRGRGRGGGPGRGRGRRPRGVQAARQRIGGFEIAEAQQAQHFKASGAEPNEQPAGHVSVQCSAPEGFAFVAGGGFELHSGPPPGFPAHRHSDKISEMGSHNATEAHITNNGTPRRQWRGRRNARRGRGRAFTGPSKSQNL